MTAATNLNKIGRYNVECFPAAVYAAATSLTAGDRNDLLSLVNDYDTGRVRIYKQSKANANYALRESMTVAAVDVNRALDDLADLSQLGATRQNTEAMMRKDGNVVGSRGILFQNERIGVAYKGKKLADEFVGVRPDGRLFRMTKQATVELLPDEFIQRIAYLSRMHIGQTFPENGQMTRSSRLATYNNAVSILHGIRQESAKRPGSDADDTDPRSSRARAEQAFA